MAESTKEEIAKAAKEKAEQVKKTASEAADKIKNMSADEAKELAKEKAEQAKKATQEALNKAKNMSADEAKELAKEKLEKMKALDNSSKIKYGGIAIAALIGIYFIFGGSSYDEEFIKSKINAPRDSEIISFNIINEENGEFMGIKGTQLALDVNFKYTGKEYLCGFEKQNILNGWDGYTFTSKTKEGCLNSRRKGRNFKVESEPGEEFSQPRTISFEKSQYALWKDKH